MDWLRRFTEAALALVALLAGGTIFRLVIAAGDRRAAATLIAVLYFVLAVAVGGAKSRRWRQNPYW